jgi:tetratricopeptide (TPR) repeat protein
MKGNMLTRPIFLGSLLIILLLSGVSYGTYYIFFDSSVRITEKQITIPTYLVNDPNHMPRFYEGRVHQGVQRRMYPYPMNDQMTGVKENRDYKIIYLENEYIKIGIMPGMGGRIYSAVDKTNGYNFFYKNDVIKPSLIGMVGYWISGGNAWGFPHHHGPNTVEPMDYTIEKHDDGRVTLWMSYTEQFHRMRMLCGFSIAPKSSVVDMIIRPYNATPLVHSFLFWANPSVHANEDYQVIFPPSVQYVTQHHKNEMTTWPVADRYYNRFDYTGLDISRWENTGVPSSFFSWKPQEDFFGGYDHGKQAGTAWIGNHHTMPGMKYWADGNNPAGVRFNDGLTDASGQYIELMAGAFTDNQPDYSWLQPYESKNVTMSWYPIRLLGGLMQANRNAALNLQVSDEGNVSVKLNTTSLYRKFQIVIFYDGQEVFRDIIDISPSKPYTRDIHLVEVESEKLNFTFLDATGKTVLSYQPVSSPETAMPEALQPPPPPAQVKTIEELYLHGLRLDQFHNASISSEPYYTEALRRDPGDYRINTQMGILYLKRKMYHEAETHLQTAVDRITMRYTRPMDSDALYYLALAKRKLNKNKEAYNLFYDASWNAGWHTPAFYQLAELDCINGDYEKALDHIDRAISTNSNHLKAQGLKVSILRKLGRLREAATLAQSIMNTDLLYHHFRNELSLIHAQLGNQSKSSSYLTELEKIMQGRVQSYLELATDYGNGGFYHEAIDILSRLEKNRVQFPMIYYLMGYYHSLLGDEEREGRYYALASHKPHNYCFPFRDEEAQALHGALRYEPGDAMALYYLGNLYYELQPDKAIQQWQQSRELKKDFYITQRNLAWASAQKNDLVKAVGYYKEAFSSHKEDLRLMFEYDDILERSGYAPQERYASIFEGNRHIFRQQSSLYLRELALLNYLGRFDEVIEILNNEKFIEAEGSQVLRDIYLDAHIFRSRKLANAGYYDAAIRDVATALEFPVGRWGSERRAQMNYLMGTYFEMAGNRLRAIGYFEKAAEELADGTEYLYEKGLAYAKLQQQDKAIQQFRALLALASQSNEADAFRSFEAGSAGAIHESRNTYLRGLAYKGMGRNMDARAQFRRAVSLNPAYLQANIMLNEGY